MARGEVACMRTWCDGVVGGPLRSVFPFSCLPRFLGMPRPISPLRRETGQKDPFLSNLGRRVSARKNR